MVLFGAILGGRLLPFDLPVLGLPLTFMLAAAAVVLLSPTRVPVWKTTIQTLDSLLPLVGTLTVVGVLVQIMALSGSRGLLSLSVVTLPLAVIIGALFIVLPLSEGVLQYGAAPLLGVPLILLFNMKGIDPIIALTGMATIWPLGDALPPTALVGRATVMTVGYQGSYAKGFLKECLVPAIFILVLGTAFVVFSKPLSFLIAG